MWDVASGLNACNFDFASTQCQVCGALHARNLDQRVVVAALLGRLVQRVARLLQLDLLAAAP